MNHENIELSAFLTPPLEYRPVPFWSWNEEMQPDEVRRQIKEIKSAGWGGAFVHSRIGLTTPYLGSEWFSAVDAAVDACATENLKIWLYDEDKWPSGFSGGTVPLANDDFRMKVLVGRPEGRVLPNAEPYCAPSNGLQIWLWTAPFGQDCFNGTSYIDTGNAAAVRKFIDDAYETYYRRYADEYGTRITAEFTDEPCMTFRIGVPFGAVPFSSGIESRFEQMHGYSLKDNIYHLFLNEPESMRFRIHYYRTINDLFENNFSRQIGEWCEKHRISFTGHYMNEHGVFAQQNWGVKIMPNYRHQQIPGVDILRRRIDDRITAKQCQSVVNQYEKKRMLSELYGAAGGSLNFEDRRWIALQQICLGVNLLNPHLSLYTMAGCRKRDFPQNIFYQQPWWSLNSVVDEPLSRLCYILSQGKYAAKLLLLHPQESSFALWQALTNAPQNKPLTTFENREFHSVTSECREKIQSIDSGFLALIDTLLGAQLTFDLGDETILAETARIVDHQGSVLLQVGASAYEAILLPSMYTLSSTVFDLLKNFTLRGGKVLLSGTPPASIDGIASPELKKWTGQLPVLDFDKAGEVLNSLCQPFISIETVFGGNQSLCWTHVRDMSDNSRVVLIVNLDRKEQFNAAVCFPGPWSGAYILDDRTGQTIPVSTESLTIGLQMSVSVAPADCLLIQLRHEMPVCPVDSGGDKKTKELSNWVVSRMDDNALPLDTAYWRESAEYDWSAYSVPIIALQESLNRRKYNGYLGLRFSVQGKDLCCNRKIHLVVEHPERCKICVNGIQVEYQGLPFWRDIRWMPIDISGLLSAGNNWIELEYLQFQYGDLTLIDDYFGRYGTEIEAIYLVGDFSISGNITTGFTQPEWDEWGLPEIDVYRVSAPVLGHSVQLKQGDVVLQGLPFYAGRIMYETDFYYDGTASSVWLSIRKFSATVTEVFINGNRVGTVDSSFGKIKLNHVLHIGENHIRIVAFNSLRNLLGPHHHPHGELCNVRPKDFLPSEIFLIQNPVNVVEKWGGEGIIPMDWIADYFVIGFQIGDVVLTEISV